MSRHTVLLHNLKELDDDLGDRADQDLALATLLSVGDRLEAVSQHTHANHDDCSGGGAGACV